MGWYQRNILFIWVTTQLYFLLFSTFSTIICTALYITYLNIPTNNLSYTFNPIKLFFLHTYSDIPCCLAFYFHSVGHLSDDIIFQSEVFLIAIMKYGDMCSCHCSSAYQSMLYEWQCVCNFSTQRVILDFCKLLIKMHILTCGSTESHLPLYNICKIHSQMGAWMSVSPTPLRI